jgi:thiosulfate/3-mercaptopyruvate sulfurtransferase
MKTYPYPPGDNPIQWVNSQWVDDHRDDPEITIVDAQPDIHDYLSEHIRGAVYFSERLLRIPHHGWPGKYISEDVMHSFFGRLGLTPDTPVIIYTARGVFRGWGDGLDQTMVAYSFARFGHHHVYVMDGGLDKWKQERRPLTRDFPATEDTEFPVQLQRDLFVTYDDVNKIKGHEDTQLIDVRPPEMYSGRSVWKKAGHIPGAINIPWYTLMDEENPTLLKPENEIRETIDTGGCDPKKNIIIYCGTGREATNPFILYKWYLNFPHVKIYEGSFTEWASIPDSVTQIGPEPYEKRAPVSAIT